MERIVRTNIPAWYYLSWQDESAVLRLGVHVDFIAQCKVIPVTAPIVEGLMKEFSFKTFCGDFSLDWGFDESFKRVGEKDSFVEFEISLPVYKNKTDKDCEKCDGTGESGIEGIRCSGCNGTGKKIIYDAKKHHALPASFTLFSTFTRFVETKTSALFPQLLTVQTITQKGLHGGSLSAELSIPVVKWLAYKFEGENSVLPEVVQAMKSAYSKMNGVLSDFEECCSFYAYVHTEYGWLNLICIGNACDMNPGSRYMEDSNCGYELSCHNTDSPIQQLTFLAGLAKLYDLVRKDME